LLVIVIFGNILFCNQTRSISMPVSNDLQLHAINTIRFLSADAVQKANSGHPGLPMGVAAMAYTLWTRHLRFNPKNPEWFGRDRFILSGGHGSMLLYSLLYLTGYDLSVEDIKNFRQWGSRTPGHPEFGLTPGVEVTTGPLGQGFGNGIGMAIAAEHMAAQFNKPGFEVIPQNIYAIVTDGDLMEGVSSEAASLAGHLELGRLVYLYDDNRISIEGSTDLAFTEDRVNRFKAYNWHVQTISDGNDLNAIDKSIVKAKEDPRPSIIMARTQIGFGLPTRQNTEKAHGEPPGDKELNGAKEKLNWPISPRFYVPDDVLTHFREANTRGELAEAGWNEVLEAYRVSFPELGAELDRRMKGELPAGWDSGMQNFPVDAKGMATRVSSGKVINFFAERVPELIGGSADLAPSNKTWINGSPAFQKETYKGRNFHFGVREHAMGACINGMAVHGGVIPYGATFFVFADYMRGAIRLSALSDYPSIWVFTHDSIGLGEDGPTHQPVEQLASLRVIPNLIVIRPADANEVIEAWKFAIARRNGPTSIILTRQNLPTIDRNIFRPADGLQKGAYILADLGSNEPDLILMASGSEVNLIIEAGARLNEDGINVRLVSFPSWELYKAQPIDYQNAVLPLHIRRRLSVEAGVAQGWKRWVGDQGDILSIEHFGASAPYETLFKEYGFTVDNIINKAKALL
jgi:transketolase